jgi:hypothetical protein
VNEEQQEQAREPWSYSGEVWTDATGRAVVVLPSFVRAHHAGFLYELTPLDSRAHARLTDEVSDDRFAVATDQPHVKVAWRITALKETGDEMAGRPKNHRR